MQSIDRKSSGFYFIKDPQFIEYNPEILNTPRSNTGLTNQTSSTLLTDTLSVVSFSLEQVKADLFVNQFVNNSLLILLMNLNNFGEDQKIPLPESSTINAQCNGLLRKLIEKIQGYDSKINNQTIRTLQTTSKSYYWKIFRLKVDSPNFAAMIERE